MDETLIRAQQRELTRTGRYYRHVCWMAVPLLCMSCYFYGLRPLLLCGAAVLTGNLCDRLVSLLRRRVYQSNDLSSESFALLIALLMPATVDWYVLIAAVLAGVFIGKEVFGGYGSYPFHPAAVGYVIAAVSWPEQVFQYPQPYTAIPLWGASAVPVSDTISRTLRSGGILNLSPISLVLGEYAAPMGTGAALVILACGLFLWYQKDTRLSAAVSFLVTSALIAFLFPRQVGLLDTSFAASLLPRLQCVRDELLTGAMLFSAVFLLNEPYTWPITASAAFCTVCWWVPRPWASATLASTIPGSALHCSRSTAFPAGWTAPRPACTVCWAGRRMRNETSRCRNDHPRPRKVRTP